MSATSNVEQGLLYLIEHAPTTLSIPQVMKLAYLVDLEHAQLYRQPLFQLEWAWLDDGPFSSVVYQAIESLNERAIIRDVVLTESRNAPQTSDTCAAPAGQAGPREIRAVTLALEKYGSMDLAQLKDAVQAHRNVGGPSRLSDRLAGRHHVVRPDTREWGDSDASTAEDEAILAEFAGLRQVANSQS